MPTLKNLKKATGTMKKKDVYYKVVDLKTKKLEWPKIVAFAGTIPPTMKKEVEGYKEDGELKEPYLKLGKVKKTLVLRVKDGKKHVGEWVLLEDYTPPDDVAGKDEEYKAKFKKFKEDRKDLLVRMQALLKGAQKTNEIAEKHAEQIEKYGNGAMMLAERGEFTQGGKAYEIAKKELDGLRKIAVEAERQLKTSAKMQDEQRSWKASSTGLDVPDYDSERDTWWAIGKCGQDITSIEANVSNMVPALEKLMSDVERAFTGNVKTAEQMGQELDDMAVAANKHWNDAKVFADRVTGHKTKFQEYKVQMGNLKDSDARQDLFDANVPSRLENSRGYVGRIMPLGNEINRMTKQLKRLQPFVTKIPSGITKFKAVGQDLIKARDYLQTLATDGEEVESLAVELENLVEED